MCSRRSPGAAAGGGLRPGSDRTVPATTKTSVNDEEDADEAGSRCCERDEATDDQTNKYQPGHVTKPNVKHARVADLHKLFNLFPPGAKTRG